MSVHSHHGSGTDSGRLGVSGRFGDPHRVEGVDTAGAAWALVDPLGRFVDIGLRPGWWDAVGAAGVAIALVEALTCARLHAALEFRAVRGGDGDAVMVQAAVIVQAVGGETVSGPRGLIRLRVTGNRVDAAELTAAVQAADGDDLAADARDALLALDRRRSTVLKSWLQ